MSKARLTHHMGALAIALLNGFFGFLCVDSRDKIGFSTAVLINSIRECGIKRIVGVIRFFANKNLVI